MSRKVTPADRFRQELMEAVGEASLGFSGYCRLVAQAMLQTAMEEEEAAAFIGRSSYKRREAGEATYRNGFKRRKVATGEGSVELFVPQTRSGPEPFQTVILDAYRRRSETLEALIPCLYVKGLSVRDISDTFEQVLEDEGLSPATASRIGQKIGEDFDAWRNRSLAGYDVLYLFVDGMHLKLHPDRAEKQPVLIAYAILWDGRKVLLHIDGGRPGELRGVSGLPAGHDRAGPADAAALCQRRLSRAPQGDNLPHHSHVAQAVASSSCRRILPVA